MPAICRRDLWAMRTRFPLHLRSPALLSASLGMSLFRQIFCQKILIPCMGPLRGVQSEIERHSLPSGGWASGSGSKAAIETTCYALMALDGDGAGTGRKAVDLLLSLQNRDGSWPAF